MPLKLIEKHIQDKMALASDLDAKVKLDFGDEGTVFVDATQTPPVILQDTEDEADLTLLCTKKIFENILNGTQDPNMAYMMGKLKVKGSMGLAMKLNAILGD